MTPDQTQEADRRLQEALDAVGGRDPREFYRERLRELKSADGAKYERAVSYYRDRLIPSVASGEAEPLAAWAEYGRVLAESVAAGRTLSIDGTGLAVPYDPPEDPSHLVLHLPDESGRRALLVSLPAELTSAQRATYDVLVAGKQRHG